jgi:hypothetical protein
MTSSRDVIPFQKDRFDCMVMGQMKRMLRDRREHVRLLIPFVNKTAEEDSLVTNFLGRSLWSDRFENH